MYEIHEPVEAMKWTLEIKPHALTVIKLWIQQNINYHHKHISPPKQLPETHDIDDVVINKCKEKTKNIKKQEHQSIYMPCV